MCVEHGMKSGTGQVHRKGLVQIVGSPCQIACQDEDQSTETDGQDPCGRHLEQHLDTLDETDLRLACVRKLMIIFFWLVLQAEKENKSMNDTDTTKNIESIAPAISLTHIACDQTTGNNTYIVLEKLQKVENEQ